MYVFIYLYKYIYNSYFIFQTLDVNYLERTSSSSPGNSLSAQLGSGGATAGEQQQVGGGHGKGEFLLGYERKERVEL